MYRMVALAYSASRGEQESGRAMGIMYQMRSDGEKPGPL